MPRRDINYWWRVAMTGLAFSGLWVGGFVLAILVIPPATFWIRDPKARGRVTRRLIHRAFQFYVRCLCLVGVISVDIRGREKLVAARGVIVVANHPSLLDVVLLVSMLPDAQCVVKYQLWRSFLLRPVIRAAGYIPNDGNPETLMSDCRAALHEGSNLIVFPEGTRSVPGVEPRFHRGFAHIATIAQSDLQPIVISCDPPMLLKGQSWYEIPARPSHFQVEVHPAIDTGTFLNRQARPLAARAIVTHLEAFYRWQVQHG